MEVTQFTYFQQAGGIDLAPISAEITYGLERLTMFLSRQAAVFDIEWGAGVRYAPVRQQEEREVSKDYFEVADIGLHWKLFHSYEGEAHHCLGQTPPPAGFDLAGHTSHLIP